MKNLLVALFAALLAPGTVASSAMEQVSDIPSSEDYVLRTWDVADGLLDNHITGVERTSDGYLWVTDFSGLFRFDGARFVRMDAMSMPGLPSRWVRPVFEAQDRSLWLGLERGGVARWHQNKAETIVPIQPRPTSFTWPWSFAEDHSGAVWTGAADGAQIARAANGKVEVYSVSDGIPAGTNTLVRVTSDGKVWCATSGGCALFDGRRFQPVDPGTDGVFVRPMLAPSRDGGMWAIRGGKLLRYDSLGKRLETLVPNWLPEAGQVNVLLEDRTGTLWIGTRSCGLLCLRGGKFERVATSFVDISCLADDREGNLWVGTWGGGLNRLSPRRFFLRQTQPGIPSDTVRSVCEDSEGTLWILNNSNQPVRALEPTGHTFSGAVGWTGGPQPAVMCADRKSGAWLGTPDGLVRWEHGVASQTSFREPVAALFMDREQVLWIATDRGELFRYHDGQAEREQSAAGARAMAEDSSGHLWIGDPESHLFRRENGRFAPVALPGAGAEEEVRFIVPDGENTVWIGTLLGGLYRWKNGKALRVPETTEVSLAEIRSLLIEPAIHAAQSTRTPTSKDVFWIGTATGLLRVSRDVLEGFLDGRRTTLPVVSCGSNEGLPNVEFTRGALNAAVQTKDGHLWFATNRGVLEIQPGVVQPPVPERVIIEEATSDSLALRPGNLGRWAFPPLPGAIRIRYTLPELRAPEQVRFRYRLASSEDGPWIDAGRAREMTILRPEPRDYRVEVTAAVGDGPWLSPTSVDVTVRAAWWQTAVFRWGSVLALIAAIAFGVRKIVMLQMRAQIRQIEQQHAVERERSRIARDMHDELGGSLTHIAAAAHLAGLEPAHATAGLLREISAAVRQTVDSLDEIVWAVNPRNDTLVGLVEYIGKFAARFLATAGIEAEITLPEAPYPLCISAEQRHHLFLAVKESLNNIAKHSGAASARLSVQASVTRLEIIIDDNGRGFDPGKVDSLSNGLVNMRERMHGVGGSCRVESRPEAGSRIMLELPLSHSINPVRK